MTAPPATPDGRYIVVRGRLWRRADPSLSPQARDRLVKALMNARRAVKAALRADDPIALKAARGEVDAAKIALGERGPPWWDGPDLNRRLVRGTAYAAWFRDLEAGEASGEQGPPG